MAPWRPPEGSWAAVGRQMPAKSAPEPLLGAILAALGPLLGRSWPLLARSWGLLGLSWGLLGRSWQRELNFHEDLEKHCKNAIRFGLPGPKLAPSWAQVGHLEASGGHLGGLGGHLGPRSPKSIPRARIWSRFGRPGAPKLEPKWSQNRAKIGPKINAKFY